MNRINIDNNGGIVRQSQITNNNLDSFSKILKTSNSRNSKNVVDVEFEELEHDNNNVVKSSHSSLAMINLHNSSKTIGDERDRIKGQISSLSGILKSKS